MDLNTQKKSNNSFDQAFDPSNFRKQGHAVVDQLADYLENINDKPVLPWVEPEQRVALWKSDISWEGGEDLLSLTQQFIDGSNHLHHPRYAGHQSGITLPSAALAEFVASLFNNSGSVYEMGAIGSGVEMNIIRWMCDELGYDTEASGVLTSGGSLGNLTALLAARQQMAENNAWEEGTNGPGSEKLSVLVSDQAHYCIQRAVKIMGWGNEGAIPVATDDNYKLDPSVLEAAYQEAEAKGRKVIAVVASCCSTSTGSYDPIDPIADFCEEKSLWLHVDGAHGAPVCMTDKYSKLLKGVKRADSVVWDAHKMMLTSALLTGVLFKNGKYSHETFAQKAQYLLGRDSQEEWYNFCHRTIECTKPMMALKLYMSLAVHGVKYFSDYVTSRYDLARKFAQIIEESSDFEIPVTPESNIVCFRYTGGTNHRLDMRMLDEIQASIRKKIISEGDFYIVQTRLDKGLYLRVSLMNPFTSIEDLKALLDKVRSIVG